MRMTKRLILIFIALIIRPSAVFGESRESPNPHLEFRDHLDYPELDLEDGQVDEPADYEDQGGDTEGGESADYEDQDDADDDADEGADIDEDQVDAYDDADVDESTVDEDQVDAYDGDTDSGADVDESAVYEDQDDARPPAAKSKKNKIRERKKRKSRRRSAPPAPPSEQSYSDQANFQRHYDRPTQKTHKAKRKDRGSHKQVSPKLPGKIIGTIVSSTPENSRIIFKQSRRLRLVSVGEKLGLNYRVIAISQKDITLRRKNSLLVLPLADW